MIKNKTINSKKILHLIDTTGPGGAETVFIQLAANLKKRKHESIVVIRGPGWVQNKLIDEGIEPIIIPAKGSFAFGFLKELFNIVKTKKVDIIQSHLLGSNVYAALVGLLTGIPVVATYHGMVDVNPNERFKFLKNLAMKWGINQYIAVSEKLLENIKKQKLLDIAKSRVIYNGVDTKIYGKGKSDKLKGQLKLNSNTILVGSLGNIREAKAYDILIEAGKNIIENHPNIHFVIAGDKKKSLMDSLEKQMKSLNVTNNFHFIGFSNNSAKFLSEVDLFTLSSSSEGFSISTIEAMASALPIVVTKCGGPEEIVTPELNAIMVSPNNASELAMGIERLLNDSSLANKLAKNGKNHVEKTFSLNNMIDKYEKLYEEILEKN